ncbi:MAG TPA: glycerol-3-phosphate 1-O-acyltransferase PlsY [Gammaproteobacteria bacterium]|jgi:glycerol-3-phosphate acyltransferase PlsY|nr:glycerol-3-phosphate 1-O-acyltransferase PlsY [Gammaproteobacteria bacterium]
MSLYLILVGLAYLFGSISSAIILCRIAGYPDPRRQGSGNPGASNILRLYGKKAAAITLAGDLLKGLLPLLIGRALQVPEVILASLGVAAFLGHLYPIFFQFEGGKGVATFIGILYGLAWPAGVAFMLVWVVIAATFRYSSLSALVATALSPALVFISVPSYAYLTATLLMAGFIFWRHQANIRKLLSGTERKIGSK